MQAVILAGGKGTRLAPYTTVLPKPLMPVGEMPILEIVIRQLRASGFTRIEMATGHLSALIEAYFGNGSRWGVEISYHVEEFKAGTAGPVALMRDALEDRFLVMNGDVLTNLNFRDLWLDHLRTKPTVTVATCERDITLSLGSIKRGEFGQVVDYVEKPTYHFECSAGIYVFEKAAVDFISDVTARPVDLPDVVKTLICSKQVVKAFPITGVWLDIGTPQDYREAGEQFEKYFGHLKSDLDIERERNGHAAIA